MKIFIETQDNSIEHVVRNMLEREYHFTISADGVTKCVISFRTGIWTIELNDDDAVQVSDSPEILFQKIEHTLAEEFIAARCQWHLAHTFEALPARTIPCIAIYDFLKFKMKLESCERITINVAKSHR